MNRNNVTRTFVLYVLVINIIAIVGCSKSPETTSDESNTPKTWYEITEEKITINDALGTKLPESATIVSGDLRFDADLGGAVREFWLIAEIDKPAFDMLVETLGMYNESTLLKSNPDIFECKSDKVSTDWDLTKEIDANTFYCELGNYEGYRIAKYENSKLYFKRAEFFEVVKNTQNEIEYKKSEK